MAIDHYAKPSVRVYAQKDPLWDDQKWRFEIDLCDDCGIEVKRIRTSRRIYHCSDDAMRAGQEWAYDNGYRILMF